LGLYEKIKTLDFIENNFRIFGMGGKMLKQNQYKNLFLVVVMLGLAGCAQKTAIVMQGYEKGALLKFNFIPGQTLKYRQTTETSITMEYKGVPQTWYTTTELTTTKTVVDTGEITTVTMNFDNASGISRMNDEMKNIKEMEEVNGKSITFKFSREGKITETKGIKDTDYFKNQEKQLISQFEESIGLLPNKVVKQGESWQRKTEDATATYTLKGFEQKNNIDCARIEGIEKGAYTENVDIREGKGKVKLNTTTKSTTFFAIKDGIILESKTTTSAEGEQEFVKDTGESMKMPIYMDMKIRTQLIH